MRVIALIGRPGSGKSSIAEAFCADSMGIWQHISSGAIAAELAAQDMLTRQALEKGDYAPEAAIRMEVMAQIEQAAISGKNVLLEGFPRKLDQVLVLEQALKGTVPTYIEVHCPAYLCLRRIIQRGRETDQPDAVASRFTTFIKDTLPMVEVLMQGADFRYIRNEKLLSDAVQDLKGITKA